MKKKIKFDKKFFSIVCVLLLLISIVRDNAIIFAIGSKISQGSTSLSQEVVTGSNTNSVQFKDSIKIPENTKEVEKHLSEIGSYDNGNYLLVYKELPTFFNNLQKGDVFCVLPDTKSNDKCFQNGFCGKLIEIRTEEGKQCVEFSVPSASEVFSKISISTFGENEVSDVKFVPSDNISVENYTPITASMGAGNSAVTAKSSSLTLNDTTVGYSFFKSDKESLLDNYSVICKKLDLKIKQKGISIDSGDASVSGNVSLEYPSIKYQFESHTDENGQAVVDKYDLGFISKQSVDLKLEAKKEVGLDDLSPKPTLEKYGILDVSDVTENEKGKIVIGTFLVGTQAVLPLLYNTNNMVSYISFGIAFQFSITASGELSLELKVNESGLMEAVANDEKQSFKVYSPNHPNPVISNVENTIAEDKDKAKITVKSKGTIKCKFAIGLDAGICILGMIPIKLSNNLIELDYTRSIGKTNDIEGNDITDEFTVANNTNLVGRNDVDYFQCSSNSYLKINLGAKLKLPGASFKLFSFGAEKLLKKFVWMQVPKPIDFKKSECSFGGIKIGKKYTDQELKDTFSEFQEELGKDSVATRIKDSVYNDIINNAIEQLGIDTFDMLNELGIDDDEFSQYKVDYFASGVLYVRDQNDKVIAQIITGNDVYNTSGFSNGMSIDSVEQTYSSPDDSESVHIEIGWLKYLSDSFKDLEDTDVTCYTYNSSNSDNTMEILFNGETEKLIIIT